MRRLTIATVCTVVLLMVPCSGSAQGRGKSGAPKPKPATGSTSHGPVAHGGATHAPSVSHGGGSASHVRPATGGTRTTATARSTGPKTHAAAGPKTMGGNKHNSSATTLASTTPSGGGKNTVKATTKSGTTKTKKNITASASNTAGPVNTTTGTRSGTSNTTTSGTNTTGGTGSTVALSPVQQKLQRNTQLASKLQSRLPAGADLMSASAGFRNLGQFVAAVNVSNNLGLDFTKLKTAMVDDGMSLGQAIQAQRKSVNGNVEATRAQHDADTMIRATESTGSTVKTPATNVKAR